MLESGVAGDFDVLAGEILANKAPLVIRGFTIYVSGIGAPANLLQMYVADGACLHFGASSSGTIYHAPNTAYDEVLDATKNPNVIGSFTNFSTNYVGLDLVKTTDNSTQDTVAFLTASGEIFSKAPLSKTMGYKINISTVGFSTSPNILPIAKVVTDANGLVTSITDCRPMMFRLGGGGDFPNTGSAYSFGNVRAPATPYPLTTISPTSDCFVAGDKSIKSLKEWQDAVMTRIWEIGGGENWFSPTGANDVYLAFNGTTFPSGDYFDTTTTPGFIYWKAMTIVFTNSAATNNTITAAGPLPLPTGYAMYVDLNRTTVSVLTPNVALISSLYNGAPIPGNRFAIAWSVGGFIYTRKGIASTGSAFTPAGPSYVMGAVSLNATAGTPTTPVVPVLRSTADYLLPAISGGGSPVTIPDGLSLTTGSLSLTSGGISLTSGNLSFTTTGGISLASGSVASTTGLLSGLNVKTIGGTLTVRNSINTLDAATVSNLGDFTGRAFSGLNGSINPAGAIVGTSLGVGGGAITGGSLNVGVGAISGGYTTGSGGTGTGGGAAFTAGTTGVAAGVTGTGGNSGTGGTGVYGMGGGTIGVGVTGLGASAGGSGIYGMGGSAGGYGVEGIGTNMASLHLFAPTATSTVYAPHIHLNPMAVTVSTPAEGDIWFETTAGTSKLYVRINGSTRLVAYV
jgi:hypothetical protein